MINGFVGITQSSQFSDLIKSSQGPCHNSPVPVPDHRERKSDDPDLAEAFDAPEALFEARGIPREIHVDERAERLEIQALACRIGGDDEAYLPFLDGRLDIFAFDSSKIVTPEHTALAGTGVDADWFPSQ